jgi:hypothetical protein
MFKSTIKVRRLFLTAGLCVVAASASAFSIDPQIMIDRALDSPTLTVRYTGVSVALVELRVNGESLGTRSVSAAKVSGETNFNLDLGILKDGDNAIEVRLFDRSGKLVGHERITIQAEAAQRGPVILSTPKMGSTVQGAVEINVSLDSSLKNPYVSFFIDGDFKSMSNFPPYSYMWDTERVSNGWHELEAWAVDESSQTHKTRKLRIFVNNPQGRTDRPGTRQSLSVSSNTDDYTLSTSDRGIRRITVGGHSAPANASYKTGLLPKVHSDLHAVSNTIESTLGSAADTKPVQLPSSIATGPHHMLPTRLRVPLTPSQNPAGAVQSPRGLKGVSLPGARSPHEVISITPSVTKVASSFTPSAQVATVSANVESATSLMTLTKGSRLPDLGRFAIALDSAFVDFHGVEPRVDDGVPMTPIRYLLEQAGGKVDWEHYTKQLHAKTAGHKIDLRIGAPQALVNQSKVSLERPAYIDHGRTIVPLSFIRSTLNVQVQYDKKTGHVLITSLKK